MNQIKKLYEINNKIKNKENKDESNLLNHSGQNTIFNTEIKNSILKYEPDGILNSDLDGIKSNLNFYEDENIDKSHINVDGFNYIGNSMNNIVNNNLNKYNFNKDINEINVKDLSSQG